MDVSATADEVELQRLRAGDVNAFDVLFARHVDEARRVARSLLRDAAAAEDAVAEAFAQTFAAIQRGRGPVDGFDRYIRRSVRHHCLRTWRRQARVRPASAEEIGGQAPARRDEIEAQVDQALLRRAFGKLSSKQRLVLWATEVEGCSHAALSDKLGMSPGAVAALAMRARQQLARAYLDLHLPAGASITKNCAEVRALLPAVVRNEGTGPQQLCVAAHVEDCRSCREAQQQLTRINAQLREVPLAPVLAPIASMPVGALKLSVGSGWAGLSALLPVVGVATLAVAVHHEPSRPAEMSTVTTVEDREPLAAIVPVVTDSGAPATAASVTVPAAVVTASVPDPTSPSVEVGVVPEPGTPLPGEMLLGLSVDVGLPLSGVPSITLPPLGLPDLDVLGPTTRLPQPQSIAPGAAMVTAEPIPVATIPVTTAPPTTEPQASGGPLPLPPPAPLSLAVPSVPLLEDG